MNNVSIIIVSYNTQEILQRCLECLINIKNELTIQVIVVDNASIDGSKNMVEGLFPTVKLLSNSDNLGFAKANNQGISVSSGDFILLLNSDAFLTGTALDTLIDFMHHNPRVGICSPQLVFETGVWQRSYGQAPSPRIAFLESIGVISLKHIIDKFFWTFGVRRVPRKVDYVDGACMLIRREVVNKIGDLDEKYFFFVEDVEYCMRAKNAGWGVYLVPSSQVVHLRGHSSVKKDLVTSQKLKIRSLKTYILDRYGNRGWIRFLMWNTINYFTRHLFCRLMGPFFSVLFQRKCLVYKDIYKLYKSVYLKEKREFFDGSSLNLFNN